MKEFDRTKYSVGDRVRPRPGAEFKLGKLPTEIGVVLAAKDVSNWGPGVMIQWPNEELSGAWTDAHLLDPV